MGCSSAFVPVFRGFSRRPGLRDGTALLQGNRGE